MCVHADSEYTAFRFLLCINSTRLVAVQGNLYGAMCLNSQCWYPLKFHCGLKAHPSAELAFKLDKQEIQVFEVLPF
jgi:hypothetical protein